MLTIEALHLILALALSPTAPGQEGAAPAARYAGCTGPFEITVYERDWIDTKRKREIPVRIYAPRLRGQSFPVIVFSHGLGGSRESYSYVGEHWASRGYVSVHPQHHGSDEELWREAEDPMRALRKASSDTRQSHARALDVRFVLDRIDELNEQEGVFTGLFDMTRVGMAGHSFGAFTTLVVIGQRSAQGTALLDPRIRAAQVMSPPVPPLPTRYERYYRRIDLPCLHWTGTLDKTPIGDTMPPERRIPFRHIEGADQFLVTFEGGDHMVFSGIPRRGELGDEDALVHELILQGSTAFWDAYLREDAGAMLWLKEGGFAERLGAQARLESKLVRRSEPRVHPSLPYAEEEGVEPELLSLDVHVPDEAPKDERTHPVLVWIHGGGWSGGDKGQVGYKARTFVEQGYLFVSVNYRLLPAGRHPRNVQDVARALAWVRREIDEYGGDPRRILLMGHSAGAHLAALVATDARRLQEVGADPSMLAGVVVLDTGALDLEAWMQVERPIHAAAFGSDPAVWADASPRRHVRAGRELPPFLVVSAQGSQARREQAEAFAAALRELGVRVELIEAAHKTHSTINRELGAPGDELTRQVLAFAASLFE